MLYLRRANRKERTTRAILENFSDNGGKQMPFLQNYRRYKGSKAKSCKMKSIEVQTGGVRYRKL